MCCSGYHRWAGTLDFSEKSETNQAQYSTKKIHFSLQERKQTTIILHFNKQQHHQQQCASFLYFDFLFFSTAKFIEKQQ